MKIETLEQFNAVKGLGILSGAEIERLEKRFARMANKPTVPEVNIEIVTGTVMSKTGEEIPMGLFVKTVDGKYGKFVGAEFRYETSKGFERHFIPGFQKNGKTLAECIIQALEQMPQG